jgi:hypothetical protein
MIQNIRIYPKLYGEKNSEVGAMAAPNWNVIREYEDHTCRRPVLERSQTNQLIQP